MTISRHLSIYTVKGLRSNLHIDSDEEQLQFYVPKDKKMRKLCYLNQLPQKLAIHLGLADTSAIRILGSIMAASSDLLNDLLMEEGIVRVRGVEASPVEASANGSDNDSSRSLFTAFEDTQVPQGSHRQTRQLGFRAASLSPARAKIIRSRSHTRNSTTTSSFLGVPSTPSSNGTSSIKQFNFSPEWKGEPTSEPAISNNDEYRALLDRVIYAANRAVLPKFNDPSEKLQDMTTNEQVTFPDTLFGPPAENKQDRISAAGELYVSLVDLFRINIPLIVFSTGV